MGVVPLIEIGAREAALIGVVAVAPLAIVLLVMFIRGYSVDLKLRRGQKKDQTGGE